MSKSDSEPLCFTGVSIAGIWPCRQTALCVWWSTDFDNDNRGDKEGALQSGKPDWFCSWANNFYKIFILAAKFVTSDCVSNSTKWPPLPPDEQALCDGRTPRRALVDVQLWMPIVRWYVRVPLLVTSSRLPQLLSLCDFIWQNVAQFWMPSILIR